MKRSILSGLYMRRRLVTTTLVTAVAVGAVAMQAGAAPALTAKKCIGNLNIGVAAGFTGAVATVGQEYLQGALQGATDINKSGGANGRCVKIVAEDTVFDATQSVTVFHDLANVKKVGAVILGGSSPIKAVAPLATQSKTILINVGGQGADLAGLSPYLFDSIELGTEDVAVTAAYMWKKGYRKIAIGSVNNSTGLPNAQLMQKTWEGFGGTVVKTVTWNQNDVSFGTQTALIKAANPDAIYFAPTTGEAPFFVSQLRQGGVSAPLFSYVAVQTKQMLSVGGAAANGMIFTSPNFSRTNALALKFSQEFGVRFGVKPEIHSALSYDSMLIIQAGYNAAHSFDTTKVAKALLALKSIAQATGAVRFKPDGTVVKGIVLKQIQNGHFVQIAAYHVTK